MEEAHTILHQITNILGMKQCTSTQILGICLEFWVGALVALGVIKVKTLYGVKTQLEQLKGNKKKSKKKRRKSRRKK